MTGLPSPGPRKLGLVIDLDTCVGCHACAVACKEWNDGGIFGPLPDANPYGKEPLGRLVQPRAQLRGRALDAGTAPMPCTSRAPACIAKRRPASPCARPAPATSAPRTASCWSTRTSASAASCAPGPARTARASIRRGERRDAEMHACAWTASTTSTLDEGDRQPACVQACPTRARHFGDLGDPHSAISRLVADRGGYDLEPDLGYKPVNKYLPPRPRRDGPEHRRRRRRGGDARPGRVAADPALARSRALALSAGTAACIRPSRSSPSPRSRAPATACCSCSASPTRARRCRCRASSPWSWSGWRRCWCCVGLLSSVLHLGQPQRAWRALSQWRSSWLSREGVAAIASLVPVAALAVLVWRGDFGAALRAERDRDRRAGAAHGVLHGAHLHLAARDPGVDRPRGAAGVPADRLVDRRAARLGPARADRDRARSRARDRDARHRAVDRRAQARLLAPPGNPRAAGHGRGHRPRTPGPGAPVRSPAHRSQLPHARDGLRARAPARGAAAPHRARPAGRGAAGLRGLGVLERRRRSPRRRWRRRRRCSARWSSAGCSSPRPATW